MKITKFYITNFRSLLDFEISKFDSTTIFYGDNNAGKSNVLGALHMIFQRKVQFDTSLGFTEPKNFYEGFIKEFTNNYFKQDETLKIKFIVDLEIATSELPIAVEIEPFFKEWPDRIQLSIEGEVSKNKQEYEKGLAEIKTNSIKVNDIIIYDPENTTGFYFPTLISKDRSNVGALSEAFSTFINPLNDCIYIISSGRDMHPIAFNHDEKPAAVSSKNFKQFLYKLYLSEKDHSTFEKINEVFSADPFSFGNISFSEINKELEIMVKEEQIRLPIKHLGSGVLQILYIISVIIFNKTKIVCLEELEQNLSPKLQSLALRKLQTMIGQNIDQLIISSHSSVFAKSKLSKAIHLIEKTDGKTQWAEEINDALGAKAKKHFIATVLPPKTYTGNAYTKFQQEW